jgi:hypothetical protein
MDRSEDHHVIWNNPDTERQVLHVLSHVETKKEKK